MSGGHRGCLCPVLQALAAVRLPLGKLSQVAYRLPHNCIVKCKLNTMRGGAGTGVETETPCTLLHRPCLTLRASQRWVHFTIACSMLQLFFRWLLLTLGDGFQVTTPPPPAARRYTPQQVVRTGCQQPFPSSVSYRTPRQVNLGWHNPRPNNLAFGRIFWLQGHIRDF